MSPSFWLRHLYLLPPLYSRIACDCDVFGRRGIPAMPKKNRWNECTSPIFTMPSAAEVTRVERKRFRAKNSSDLTCWGFEITVSRGSRFGIIRHWLPGCSGLAFGWLASLAQLSAPSTSAWAAIGGGTHSSRTSRGTRRGKSILRCFQASSIRVFPRRMPSSDCRGRSTPRSSYQRRSVLKMRKFLNIFGAQFVSHPKKKTRTGSVRRHLFVLFTLDHRILSH